MSLTPVLINRSVTLNLLDAVTAATHTGDTFALPPISSLSTVQSLFTGTPASITILIEGSSDGSGWSTLATLNSTSDEEINVTTALPFIRARISAISVGTCSEITVAITCKPYTVQEVTNVNPNAAPSDSTYLTVNDESGDLINSRRLLPGTNVTFDDTVAGERTVNASGGGGGGISGSIAAGQVAVGDGVDSIAGDANLTYAGGALGIKGTLGQALNFAVNSADHWTEAPSGVFTHDVGFTSDLLLDSTGTISDTERTLVLSVTQTDATAGVVNVFVEGIQVVQISPDDGDFTYLTCVHYGVSGIVQITFTPSSDYDGTLSGITETVLAVTFVAHPALAVSGSAALLCDGVGILNLVRTYDLVVVSVPTGIADNTALTPSYLLFSGALSAQIGGLGDNAGWLGYTAPMGHKFSAALQITPCAVSALPTSSAGMIATVNDALAPTVGSPVASGGAAFALVCYNGSNWNVVSI